MMFLRRIFQQRKKYAGPRVKTTVIINGVQVYGSA